MKQSLADVLELPKNSLVPKRRKTSLAQTGLRKSQASKVISLVLCFAVAGCANDQQTTKTQGTVFGALLGATAGAAAGAIGGALTGNSDNIVRGAIAGAVVGGVSGGVVGYQWGKRVAFKKEQYATSEDRLNKNIHQASIVRAEAAQENNELRGQITTLNGQLRQLSANAAAGKDDRQIRKQMASTIDQQRHDAARKIVALGNEIEDRTDGLRGDSNGNPQQMSKLKSQIGDLTEERKQMQENEHQLGSISSRTGV
jgi:hypothetical protein